MTKREQGSMDFPHKHTLLHVSACSAPVELQSFGTACIYSEINNF